MLKKGQIKENLLFLLKLLVTFSLCLFLVLKADWGTIWNAVYRANPFLILVVFAAMILSVVISAIKWRLLLSSHNISFDLSTLQRYYFVALFLNNFLPSNIGGDFYRIYKTYKNGTTKAGAVISVFLERVTGLWALLFLGAASAIILVVQNASQAGFIDAAAFLLSIGAVLPIAFSVIFFFFAANFSSIKWLPRKIIIVIESLRYFFRDSSTLTKTLAISFLFHLFSLIWRLILFRAVGTDFPVLELAVAISISTLAALLPLSINGIGLMDGSFIYLATGFGVNYDFAMAFLLLVRGLAILLSLLGGFFYLKDRPTVDKLKHLEKDRISSIKESTS